MTDKGKREYVKGPVSVRLAMRTRQDPDSECLVWTGLKNVAGYGRVWNGNGKVVLAHRAAYEAAKGPIPEGFMVCHTCDNPPCVNPDHLFVGTNADNVADMHAKGRASGGSSPGESHPMVKLTAGEVSEIRRDNRLQREIAADYGISQTHVSAIKVGRAWK